MKHIRKDYNRIQDPDGIIPLNEPVFLFRGQDRFAPQVLEFYAQLVEDDSEQSIIPEITREQAENMRKWQRNVKVKKPDL